ncbi:MAG TPA: hypothetical protein VFU88_19565 [Ktedonobacterales bacterium]|nr:hypothetical protein [Ktedonobacterales bacterium]
MQTHTQTQTTLRPSQSQSRGRLHALRVRWLGERDPVDRQLADIERQGAWLASLAHVAALALVVLFSLGSLLALSHDALNALQHDWQQTGTVNLTAAISAAVSTLLVVCMDTAMLYAATMLRVMRARKATGAETRPHIAVLIGVSLIEGATWAYFSYLYDRPHDPIAWSLIGARAIAAPLLSAYLSLARPLPIGPRDILYQAEMGAAKGVIRDVTAAANDPAATLDGKIDLYNAAAEMLESDRKRLAAMIEAAKRQSQSKSQGASDGGHPPTNAPRAAAAHPVTASAPVSARIPLPHPLTPNTSAVRTREDVDQDPLERAANPDAIGLHIIRSNVRPGGLSQLAAPRSPRADTGRPKLSKDEMRARRVKAAKRILAANPDIGTRELTRRIAMATSYHISESTAHAIRESLRGPGASAAAAAAAGDAATRDASSDALADEGSR